MLALLTWAIAAGVVNTRADLCPGEYHGTPPRDFEKNPSLEDYDKALKALDVHAVMRDLEALFVESQECWPADNGNYGPFFIRLAWHCSGSYRESDQRGGCAGGRQRFEPERSWQDNANLNKARALLWPIKQKYGDGLSWGDLFVLAGTTAIHSLGGPVTQYCAGRIDDDDGEESVPLGIDLRMYVNAEGPSVRGPDGTWAVVADPALSAADLRGKMTLMDLDDYEAVALVSGGHTFGKAHGACPYGPGPSPKEQPFNPWSGACGTGKGVDTYTSGMEGPWTTNPYRFDDEFLRVMLNSTWEKFLGPGGKWQWRIPDATGPLAKVIRLTSDLALIHDPKYLEIVKKFVEEPAVFRDAFDQAWFRLTTATGRWSTEKKCVSPSIGSSSMRGDDMIV